LTGYTNPMMEYGLGSKSFGRSTDFRPLGSETASHNASYARPRTLSVGFRALQNGQNPLCHKGVLGGRYRDRTCDLCRVNAKRKPPVTTGPCQIARDSWLLGAYPAGLLRSVSSPHVAVMWSRLPVTRQREHTLGPLVGDGVSEGGLQPASLGSNPVHLIVYKVEQLEGIDRS